MKLNEMTKEDIELMSYTDLTYMILKENKKPMLTPTIFKTICDMLEYSDEEYASKIGDYYTSLSLDKRFVMLDSGEWDVRDNHSISIELDEDEEDEENDDNLVDETLEEDEIEPDITENDDIDADIDDDDLIDDDDELDQLNIIADEEDEEENE